jgi:hypothetical protein
MTTSELVVESLEENVNIASRSKLLVVVCFFSHLISFSALFFFWLFIYFCIFFCFLFKLGYYLCAEAEDELKAWIDCIKRSITGSAKQTKEMTADDFSLLHTIGKGSFGKVLQVKKKDTGQIYAMKILNKKNIIDNNEVIHFGFKILLF